VLAWRALAVAVAAAGLALRWSELGTYGLSNDEAWVGLATRVDGFAQARLAIAMTPVGWAALVKLASLGSSELALRLVPFAFGGLTMVVAWRAGRRFAGHELGGVLALAVVAFDPLGIAYARILKQYTAEAFFALLAIDRAAAWAACPRRSALVTLALVLTLGTLFANAQLFLGPPICAALLVVAARRGDRRTLVDVAAMTAVVGIANAVVYRALLAPRLPAVTDAYWAAQVYLPPNPLAAARIIWERLGWTLRASLGAAGFPVGMVALALASLRPRTRPTGLVLALLLAELAVLSMLHVVAVSQPRILLFLTSALGAFAGAAIAALVVRADGPAMRIVAGLAFALLVVDFARVHAWRTLAHATQLEDAGPLVREFERDAGPNDALLLHERSLFVYGFYQRATPVLDPMPLSVGYLPRVTDPRVTVVNDLTVAERARAAFARTPRVWFVGSRLRPLQEGGIRAALEPLATTVREQRRPGAIGLRLERRPADGR